MIDVDFIDHESCVGKNRGEEAMESIKRDEEIDMISMHRLEGATRVADAVVNEPPSHGVGDTGGQLSTEGVLSFCSPSHLDISLPGSHECYELANIGGIVLTISIEHHENIAGRKVEARKKRPTLAPGFGKTERGLSLDRVHDLPSAV